MLIDEIEIHMKNEQQKIKKTPWAPFRFWNKVGITLFVCVPVLFVIMISVQNMDWLFSLVLIALLGTAVSFFRVMSLRCPRCNKLFYIRSYGLFISNLTRGRHCMHCGLKLYEGYHDV